MSYIDGVQEKKLFLLSAYAFTLFHFKCHLIWIQNSRIAFNVLKMLITMRQMSPKTLLKSVFTEARKAECHREAWGLSVRSIWRSNIYCDFPQKRNLTLSLFLYLMTCHFVCAVNNSREKLKSVPSYRCFWQYC